MPMTRLELTGTRLGVTCLTIGLAATALGTAGDTLPDPRFTWSSANPAVASVDPSGQVRALSLGFALPRFSSGAHGSSTASQGLWQALYDAGADVIIVGHDHTSEFRQNTKHGVLKLTLHAAAYDWAFVAIDGSVMDQGSGACH